MSKRSSSRLVSLCGAGVAVLALTAGLSTPETARQIFVNADDNRESGYCYGGVDYVVREALTEQTCGAGGWGRRVPCYVELYENDVWIGTYPYECEIECCSADLDGDGDVDLEDFAVFQRLFTGEDPTP